MSPGPVGRQPSRSWVFTLEACTAGRFKTNTSDAELCILKYASAPGSVRSSLFGADSSRTERLSSC